MFLLSAVVSTIRTIHQVHVVPYIIVKSGMYLENKRQHLPERNTVDGRTAHGTKSLPRFICKNLWRWWCVTTSWSTCIFDLWTICRVVVFSFTCAASYAGRAWFESISIWERFCLCRSRIEPNTTRDCASYMYDTIWYGPMMNLTSYGVHSCGT